MNKYLLLCLIWLIGKPVCAQWFPMNVEQSLSSYASSFPINNEQIFAHDSMIYLLRYGGIEFMNLNTGQVSYRYSKCYNSGIIKPDTGANFMAVKNGNQIVCYNFAADSFYNLPQPFNGNINDIGRSATYIWALINNHVLGRFDGTAWLFDTLTATYTSVRLLVKDDSTAYTLSASGSKVYSYQHNTFNYAFASLVSVRHSDPWDIDSRGNLWIADSTQLLEVGFTGLVTTFNAANSPLGAVGPLNVLTDNNGNTWATGNSYEVCRYNGQNWISDTLAGYYAAGLYIGIDKESDSLYAWSYNDLLTTISNHAQSSQPIGNMPYRNITALNGYYIATQGGIFRFSPSPPNYNPSLIPIDFIDTARAGNPYAFDATCLINGNTVQYLDTAHALLYGTHHGVYGLNGLIDNSRLPDTVINCLYYADSVLYIGTNKGLCLYKNNVYTIYDTSNSPLPSNKVQYITNNWINNNPYVFDSLLYVGTDKGLAIKTLVGWRVFDTAYFHVNSVSVTGIIPTSKYSYNPYDSTTFIGTLGSGLIALKTDGSYTLYNRASGYSPSDSIYSLSYQDMGGCGAFLIAAMPGAGLAFEPNYSIPFQPLQNYINYQITLADSSPYTYFCAFQPENINWYDAITLFSQGTGLAITYAGGCVGVQPVTSTDEQLKWNYENNTLKIFLPGNYTGPCTLAIYNIEGRLVGFKTTTVLDNSPIPLNVSQLSAGLYIVKASLNGTALQTKAVITR